jgi:outer membrane protein
MRNLILIFLPILLGLAGAQAADAQAADAQAAGAEDDCKGPSTDCVAVGRWNFSVALGAGAKTNPLVAGKVIPLVVVPQFSYYGKRFFIDDLDLGFTLAETAASTFNLVASPGYDRVFFYRTDLQNIFVSGFGTNTTLVHAYTPGAVQVPPRPRHITYLAGPEWTLKYGGVTGQVDVLHEITGQNHGNEVRAALGVPLIQGRGSLTANVGLTWKSAAMVNYYYGAGTIYRPGSALDPFFKLGYTLPLAGKWRFYAFAEYERLASAIADSPIVAERYVATSFIGAIYTF